MKEIRKELKKEFPASEGWTLSVTKRNHSSVHVAVMTAPIRMHDGENGYESVNYFRIAEHYREKPEVRDVLLKIYGIMNKGNHTISEDGDYGSVPEFYVDLSIGRWDKPFSIKK